MKNFPNMKTSYPGVTSKEIDDIEIELKCKLPNDVREFYLVHNGGILLDDYIINVYEDNATAINRIFSIGNKGEINALDEYKKYISRDRIPVKSFPFANDPGGNLFIIILEEDNFGKVYFWDHNFEDGDIDEGPYLLKDFRNMSFLSNGIIQFFDMLYL